MPEIEQVDPRSITIPPRQRKNYTKLDKLQVSIRRFGLIQPIVVTQDLQLLVGGRRLYASLELGLDRIPIIRQTEDLTPVQQKEVELEENIQREDLSPTEELEAISELHDLKQELYGIGGSGTTEGWSVTDTADLSGKSVSGTSTDIQSGNLLRFLKEEHPELYKKITEGGEVKTKSKIHQSIKRLTATIVRAEDVKKAKNKYPELLNMIKQGDCLELIKEVPDGSIECIITDPPYGVFDENSLKQRTAELYNRARVMYDDSPDHVMHLIRTIAPELFRVMKVGTHLYMFCALGGVSAWKDPLNMPNFFSFAHALSDAGFWVRPTPLIWVKDLPFAHVPDPFQAFPQSYEAIIFAKKGSRPFNQKVQLDTFTFAPVTGTKDHIAQKPVTLIRELLKYSGVRDGMFLDPFCGSGAHLVAAMLSGMSILGFELDEKHADLARTVIEKEITTEVSLGQESSVTKQMKGGE